MFNFEERKEGEILFLQSMSISYREVSHSKRDNIVVTEDLERSVGENTEDDEDVTNNSDDDDTNKNQNCHYSLPEKVKLISFVL